jgi:hypothetical protein
MAPAGGNRFESGCRAIALFQKDRIASSNCRFSWLRLEERVEFDWLVISMKMKTRKARVAWPGYLGSVKRLRDGQGDWFDPNSCILAPPHACLSIVNKVR